MASADRRCESKHQSLPSASGASHEQMGARRSFHPPRHGITRSFSIVIQLVPDVAIPALSSHLRYVDFGHIELLSLWRFVLPCGTALHGCQHITVCNNVAVRRDTGNLRMDKSHALSWFWPIDRNSPCAHCYRKLRGT